MTPSWLGHGLVIVIYVLVSIAGLTLLKIAPSTFTPRFIIGAALYGAGFLIWIYLVLRVLPLSIAFPVAASALIIGSQISGWFVLKEPVSVRATIGVVLILAGLLFVASSPVATSR